MSWIKDGRTTHPLYYFWRNMLARCYNRRHRAYKYYGGRGIEVCKRWLKSFWNFAKDMGKRPSSEHTLGRKNSNKNYTPKNCCWETRSEQMRNTCRNVLITANGETLTQQAWAEKLKVPRERLAKRRQRGWSDDAVINT